jgi:hypothetical protein
MDMFGAGGPEGIIGRRASTGEEAVDRPAAVNLPRNLDSDRTRVSGRSTGGRRIVIRNRAESSQGGLRRYPTLGRETEVRPELREPKPAQQHSDLTRREATEFVKSTVGSAVDFVIQKIAAAHGAALVYNAVKLVYGATKWEQTAEDGGGVDLQIPLPLGHGAVLEAAFHLGGNPDTPPITLGLAPTGESGAGALSLGRLEIDPDPGDANVERAQPQLPTERFGPVQIVFLQLQTEHWTDLEPADAAFAVRDAAAQALLPPLQRGRQILQDAGVQLIMVCDSRMGLALWAYLGDTNRSEPTVTTTAEGQLIMGLVPDAVDLVVGRGAETELSVSLRLRDCQGPSETALISANTSDSLETGEQYQEEARPDQVSTMPGKGAAQLMSSAQPMRLTCLEPVPVTSVWPTESDHFTPWLLQHGSLLGKALGIGIDLQPWEDMPGQLSAGVIGRETATGRPVIIEKQYGPTDDLHLGRILTYVADIEPSTIIWIAEEFREQHLAAFDWLNEHTDPTIRFFAVSMHVVTLAGAPGGLAALIFQLAVRPS